MLCRYQLYCFHLCLACFRQKVCFQVIWLNDLKDRADWLGVRSCIAMQVGIVSHISSMQRSGAKNRKNLGAVEGLGGVGVTTF